MNFLNDIKKFETVQLAAPPKHEPYWKPEPGPTPVYNIRKVPPGSISAPAPEPEPEPEEVLPEITQHPIVTWLQNVGVELDVEAYATNLIGMSAQLHFHSEKFLDCVGFNTVDDIMFAEPTVEDLIGWGFADDADRNKVYFALHPEEVPAPDVNEREMALFELILSKIDNGTATDEDLEFYVVMKAKHGLK